MANVTIITTENIFIVDFGVFAQFAGYRKAIFQKSSISFQLMKNDEYVRIENAQGENWSISFAQSGAALIIDSVDGVAPVSNEDLFNILYSKI